MEDACKRICAWKRPGTVSEAAKSRGDYDLLVGGQKRAVEKPTPRLQNLHAMVSNV